VGLEVILKICVREGLGSNIGQVIGYPDWGFLWFSSLPSTKCRDTNSSFHIPSNSSFIYHPTIRRYRVSILKTSLNNPRKTRIADTGSKDRLCGLVVRVSCYRSRGPGFDSRRYQIFWVVVGLERGSFSLMNTTEGQLGRNSSASGLENREYGSGDPLRWPRDTLYAQKSALTSPTSGGRPVCIVRFRTKTTEFVLFVPLSKHKLTRFNRKNFQSVFE
jgi:hypothetical protein